MSADNIIYVWKEDDYFHVWEQSASVDLDYEHGYKYKKFKTRAEALEYAHDICNEIGYVEYNVCEIKA